MLSCFDSSEVMWSSIIPEHGKTSVKNTGIFPDSIFLVNLYKYIFVWINLLFLYMCSWRRVSQGLYTSPVGFSWPLFLMMLLLKSVCYKALLRYLNKNWITLKLCCRFTSEEQKHWLTVSSCNKGTSAQLGNGSHIHKAKVYWTEIVRTEMSWVRREERVRLQKSL